MANGIIYLSHVYSSQVPDELGVGDTNTNRRYLIAARTFKGRQGLPNSVPSADLMKIWFANRKEWAMKKNAELRAEFANEALTVWANDPFVQQIADMLKAGKSVEISGYSQEAFEISDLRSLFAAAVIRKCHELKDRVYSWTGAQAGALKSFAAKFESAWGVPLIVGEEVYRDTAQ